MAKVARQRQPAHPAAAAAARRVARSCIRVLAHLRDARERVSQRSGSTEGGSQRTVLSNGSPKDPFMANDLGHLAVSNLFLDFSSLEAIGPAVGEIKSPRSNLRYLEFSRENLAQSPQLQGHDPAVAEIKSPI